MIYRKNFTQMDIRTGSHIGIIVKYIWDTRQTVAGTAKYAHGFVIRS